MRKQEFNVGDKVQLVDYELGQGASDEGEAQAC